MTASGQVSGACQPWLLVRPGTARLCWLRAFFDTVDRGILLERLHWNKWDSTIMVLIILTKYQIIRYQFTHFIMNLPGLSSRSRATIMGGKRACATVQSGTGS